MRKLSIQLLLIVLAGCCYVITRFYPIDPMFIETSYSTGWNQAFIQRFSQLTGLIPFSLFECLIYLAVLTLLIAFLYYLFQIIHHPHQRLTLFIKGFLQLMTAFSIGYLIFLLFWGMNYHRASLETSFSLSTTTHSKEELIELYTHLIEMANEVRPLVDENEDGVFKAFTDYRGVFKRASLGYVEASKTYPVLSGNYGDPKPILASNWLNYTNITGIYSPFTAEANVNIATPDSTLLFTTMHEMAHQRGYAHENEANFIAFITCLSHPDADFIYAGYLSALSYTNVALAKVDRETLIQLNEQLDESVRRDLRYVTAFWSQYEGKVEETFQSMNQSYLTFNGVSDGVQSYGRVVDLLLDYYHPIK